MELFLWVKLPGGLWECEQSGPPAAGELPSWSYRTYPSSLRFSLGPVEVLALPSLLCPDPLTLASFSWLRTEVSDHIQVYMVHWTGPGRVPGLRICCPENSETWHLANTDSSAEQRHSSLYVSSATRPTRCSFTLHPVGDWWSFLFVFFLGSGVAAGCTERWWMIWHSPHTRQEKLQRNIVLWK